MKQLDNRLLRVLDLINYFLYKEDDFIVGSLDLYIYINYGISELYNIGIFEKDNPSLKIFFSDKNIKFYFDKTLYGIPIFPPVNTHYYKLYEKLINMYGSVKIDFIILKNEDYLILKNNTEKLENINLLNLDFYILNFIDQIDFKIKSIEKTTFFGLGDIYRIIFKMQVLYKYLVFNNISKEKLEKFVFFFHKLDFQFGRKFTFDSGNIKKTYIGTARVLFEDNLSISNDFINTFNKGDVIISYNTSVSYMKYIVKSGGIITINNNKLSHASIISRELSLPLILGAKNIFIKIFDGDLIEMNSGTGEINVLKRFFEI